jgi:hypothetical protein
MGSGWRRSGYVDNTNHLGVNSDQTPVTQQAEAA